MDPAGQIFTSVRQRIDALAEEILRFLDNKQQLSGRRDLPETLRAERIRASRERLTAQMDSAFGYGSDSLRVRISQIAERAGERGAEAVLASRCAEIWTEELPGLRRFLEYCAGLIEAHRGPVTPEMRDSHICLLQAEVVMTGIAARVEKETGTGPD